jgi:hypothetical protein
LRKEPKMANLPTFNAPAEYYELWRYSIEDPERFWAEPKDRWNWKASIPMTRY